MPPATRSSAPSTPAKPRVADGPASPPGTSSRRTPHCTKCHRPRAGHPRSGCPYVDTPNPTSPTSLSAQETTPVAAQAVSAADDGLSEELSSLQIVSPTEANAPRGQPATVSKLKRRLSVRFALAPEQTLASLSPTDTLLVEQLLQPGIMTDTVTPEDRVAHVLRWRKTLDGAKQGPAPVKAEPPPDNAIPPLSRCMPCTLSTPTVSQAPTEPVSDQYIGGSAVNMNETVYLLPDSGPAVMKPEPLSRSMSFAQRSLFLQQLSHSSSTAPATLFSFPLADLDSVQSDAEKIGFHVRVLPDRQSDYRWVALGTEQEAVDFLAKKFLEEENRSSGVKGRSSKLTAVAGGVVVGAVATWTSLAFS